MLYSVCMSDGGGIGGKLGNITTEALGNLSDSAGSELKNVAGAAISQTTGLQIKPPPKVTQQQIDQMAKADKASTTPLLQQHRKELQEISEQNNTSSPDLTKTPTPESSTQPPQMTNESAVHNKSMIIKHHEEAQKLGQKSPEELAQEEQEKQMKQLEEEQKKQEEAKKMTDPVELPGSAPKGPGVPGKKTMPMVVKDAVDKDIGRQKKG